MTGYFEHRICARLRPCGEGRRRSGGKGQQFGGVCGTGDGASHPVSSTSAVVRWGGEEPRVLVGKEEQRWCEGGWVAVVVISRRQDDPHNTL